MTDTLPDGLRRLVADEPALHLTADAVRTNGRRLRLRRHMSLATGAVVTAAAAAVGAVALSDNGSQADRLSVTPFAMSGSAATAASTDPGLSADEQRIADAIRAASPSGWTFDFSADRWDGSGVEATADDGTGAGRLMIGITTKNGSQQLHPCDDPEFKAGVGCVERTLADGSVLSLRDVIDWHGTKYIDVVVTHPDGTGVMAESGNFVIDWPPPQIATPEMKRHLTHVTRSAPTYDVQQLASVVQAVDRATS